MNCGTPLEPGTVFCPNCGAKQEQTPPPAANMGANVGGTSTPQFPLNFGRVEENYGESLNQEKGTVRKTVRKYFLGGINPIGLVLVAIGVVLALVGLRIYEHLYRINEFWAWYLDTHMYVLISIQRGLALVFVLAGCIACLFRGKAGEQAVLQAEAIEKENLKKRAIEKLGVDQSQISLIDPIVLDGFGAAPDSSLDTGNGKWSKSRKTRKGIRGAYDPVETYRFDSQGKLHALLLQETCFFFTETQLLVYTGNVDISTGKIYDETLMDIFYQDIGEISTNQKLWKLFDSNKKKFQYKIAEQLMLMVQGSPRVFSINKADVKASTVDNQIAGMKALVREKKN